MVRFDTCINSNTEKLCICVSTFMPIDNLLFLSSKKFVIETLQITLQVKEELSYKIDSFLSNCCYITIDVAKKVSKQIKELKKRAEKIFYKRDFKMPKEFHLRL